MSNVPFASNNAIYNGKTEGELFGINHMWNLMQLSGKWYGADVTFAVSARESAEDASDAEIYHYFGMSDAVMQDHFPSDVSMAAFYQNIPIPSCDEELQLPQKKQFDGNGDADKEAAALSVDAIYVKISAEGMDIDSAVLEERDFSGDPALFLNRFLFGMIEAVEKTYSVDAADRTLYGEDLGANMGLYLLFQSDGLACNMFSRYVCVDPDLYDTVGGKSLMAWEAEYFQRCWELAVSLTIGVNDSTDPGKSSRTGLLADIIKKREYRNLILEDTDSQ